MEILKLDMVQNSPMLDNRGEETEDAEGDKTQSKNHGGVNIIAGSANKTTFNQNVPEFGDAKPEPARESWNCYAQPAP